MNINTTLQMKNNYNLNSVEKLCGNIFHAIQQNFNYL